MTGEDGTVFVEQRVYTVATGRMPDLLERFQNHTNRLFTRHGILPLVFLTDPQSPDTLTYYVTFRDPHGREDAWESFLADPEWVAVKAASEEVGPLVLHLESRVLEVVDISHDWIMG